MLRFAGFELDGLRAQLRGADGAVVRLRPKAFAMLQMFVANAGRALSKQELMEAVWLNVHVAEDSLFQCIREIRVSLGDNDHKLIKRVSGRGYLFEAEVTAVPAEAAELAATPEAAEAAAPGSPKGGEGERAALEPTPQIFGDTPEVAKTFGAWFSWRDTPDNGWTVRPVRNRARRQRDHAATPYIFCREAADRCCDDHRVRRRSASKRDGGECHRRHHRGPCQDRQYSRAIAFGPLRPRRR